MDCPQCHAANASGAEACFSCGRPLGLLGLRQGALIAGRYELLETLGSGGMGMVFKAHDRTLDETVAMKVLRPEVAGQEDMARRFQSEIKLARKVRHRNVCGIHEYGEDGGLRYIAMEYIEGVDLRKVLTEHGPLAVDQAFDTCIHVAEGLQAIHEAGIVHRDLKTANLMRDAQGVVRLMDFGIAKQVGEGATMGATATGLVIGTPEYMSPEQARGEVATAASDMYSFGLLLQELFTGRPPYESDLEHATLLEKVRRGRTLAPAGVGSDLAGLIERLKSVPPTHRPTALEALERLRWIRDKPKRRLRILAAVGVLVALALGGVKYAVDLERERTAAVEARQEADRRRRQAEDLIGFMLGDLREKLEPVGRLEILDDVGAKAMAYFAAVPEEALSDEELLRRSKALYQIGSVRIAQGNLDTAAKPLEESLELAKTLVARAPADGERLYELAQSHFWVGFVRWRRRDLHAALQHFWAYSDIAEQLVAKDPGRTDWQLELASAHSNIGSVLQERDDSDGALVQFRACLAIERALLEKDPDNNTLRRAVAASNNTIGGVQRSRGRLAEALEHHRTELAIQEELVRREPGNASRRMYLGVSHNEVGVVLETLGNVEGALQHYRTSIAISEGLAAHDPTNMEWKRELARHHFRIGRALLALGARGAEMLEHLQAAVAVLRTLVAGDPSNLGWRRDLAEARSSLGDALLARGDLEGAAREATAGLEIAERLLEKDTGDRQALRLRSLNHALLGRVWSTRGKATKAREAWQESLASIAPVARRSKDDRLLHPWVSALLHLDRKGEAAVVAETLTSSGYRYPPFVEELASMRMGQPVLPTKRPTRKE